MRADARRNYDRLLVSARAAFLARGTDASLDDIARDAGVGNATLYRHFPTREALLEAVFQDRVNTLCGQADELMLASSPADALCAWLCVLIAHISSYRGLAAWLMATASEPEAALTSCKESIRTAGAALLTRAQQAGAIRPDVDQTRLHRLAHAIAIVTEQAPEEIDPLLSLMMDGLRPSGQQNGQPGLRCGLDRHY